MSPCVAFRMVKLGGSLLGWEPSLERLACWLNNDPHTRNVILVGGGGLANVVRRTDRALVRSRSGTAPAEPWTHFACRADRLIDRSESDAHWLCVRAMQATARLVAQRLPHATLAIEPGDIAGTPQRTIVFDPWRFLRECEPQLPGQRLEESWRVTSDSIAARLAIVLGCDELVLLKSVLPPLGVGWRQLAECGYVDALFPRLAADLPSLRAVNLRDAAFPTRPLLCGPSGRISPTTRRHPIPPTRHGTPPTRPTAAPLAPSFPRRPTDRTARRPKQ